MNTHRRMPAEWEPHAATWIAWPYEPTDWPGKIEPVYWVYTEIVRALSASERVELVCANADVEQHARECLSKIKDFGSRVRFHVQAHDRGWLRDSAPTIVLNQSGGAECIQWNFNAWAKYENFLNDRAIPPLVSRVSGHPVITASRSDTGEPFVLEGGAIETDGQGTLLVTEECLLSPVQERNPGLSREGYESIFREYLGITKTVWLDRGCAGDDTHGHIDDITRFVAPHTVVTAVEPDTQDENHEPLLENLRRLQNATDARGKPLTVIPLPMPKPVYFDGMRLPASYANFYIANSVVIVPTFNDVADREALTILAKLFPTREVVGVHSLDLVWGLGTLHCLSQQQPAAHG